jgi:hypothetical protein
MQQQNNIWPANQVSFPGMDDNMIETIEEDLFNTFYNPDFAPVFHLKIKEALNARRHAQGLPPYDDNHFQAALNVFLIDEGIYPDLRLPFPETAAENVATGIQAAPAMGGRRKRATRKRATRKRASKRTGRKHRKISKTKKQLKRK